jgi:Rod binding domain-containing protein
MEAIGLAAAGAGPAGAGPEAAVTPQPRLVRAAHEFEAQMMKELMKPLNQGAAPGGDDSGNDGDDSGAGSAGALGEFASEALGRALSQGGGFGIATAIVKQLTPGHPSPQGNRIGTIPVTGNLHGNTEIKPHKPLE